MSTYENILIGSKDGVVRITINRAEKLNALNRATLTELEAAILALDPEVRVLVITGAGDKAFVAGADISEMADLTAEQGASFARLGHEVFARLESLEFPVIAAVNGYALGGGCELALAADFIIASDKARFGQPEVSLGVTAGFGGTVRLSRRVGDARARQLLFTGEMIKADEAYRLGLVNEVVPSGDLMTRVDAIAAKIMENAPRAVSLSKRATRFGEESDLEAACAFEQQVFGLCFATHDQKEGMRAFLDKRKPAWIGR